MTNMPTPHPFFVSRAIANIEHMAPSWFALVMGWCGLAQAWLRSGDTLGQEALSVAIACGIFAAFVFGLLCIASIVRLSVHGRAVEADMRHPVRHAFMATLPISIMLLASLGISLLWHMHPHLDLALTVFWLIGSLLEVATTVWVMSRWLQPNGLQWATFTPVFFIPIVGNVLAPLGGVPVGMETWAAAQLGFGLLMWPVLQTLLIVRLVQAGPLPERMAPTLFITLVPPSVGALSLLQLGAPLLLVWALWGIGAVLLAWVLTQVRTMMSQPFGLPHWGASFPLAAFTALSLTLSQNMAGRWLEVPALVLLALTTLLIVKLTLNTWRGLHLGHLLVPEK